jgi:nicotinamidase-related amidase
MSRTALFVVDIQHALALSPSTSIPHARRIVDAGTSILAKARATIDAARSINKDSNVEIVIVQHEERPEQGNLQRGTQAWDLVFPPRENDGCERLVGKAVRTYLASPPF